MGTLGRHGLKLSYRPSMHEIICERTFALTAYLAPKKIYEPIRNAFDDIHRRDAHTLTLKRQEATAAAAAAGTPAAPPAPPAAPGPPPEKF